MTSIKPYDARVRGHDVIEGGHRVRRLLPCASLPMVGPFVLFDHFGPATLAPGQGVDIAPHGHAHFAAVTYFFAGATHHTDDLGNDVIVEAGDLAWMHAGAGIVHAERTPDALRARGGAGHGIQAWVALPEAHERSAPRYEIVRAHEVPAVQRDDLTLRVLVGACLGVRSPIETSSHVLFVEVRAGARGGDVTLDAGEDLGAGRFAVLFADGLGAVGGHRAGVGTLVLLPEGQALRLALAPRATALVLGGAPLGRRFLEGNVIASTEERLEQALRELAGRVAHRA